MDGHLLIEPTSPFVAAGPREEVRVALPLDRPPPLLLDLLGAPDRVLDRLLDPDELERTLLGSLGAITAGTGLFAVVMMLPQGAGAAVRTAVLTASNLLIALAAALGPIWAASLLVAARLPLVRLVGTLLTAAAAGALILAALAPIPYFLHRWDALWCGPLAVLACFALSALVAGARIHRTLLAMAERSKESATGEPLDPAERHRVGILARTAMMIFSFTGALSVWGFDALLF